MFEEWNLEICLKKYQQWSVGANHPLVGHHAGAALHRPGWRCAPGQDEPAAVQVVTSVDDVGDGGDGGLKVGLKVGLKTSNPASNPISWFGICWIEHGVSQE